VTPYLVLAAAALAAAPPSSQSTAPQPSVENVYWAVNCLVDHGNHDVDRVLAAIPGQSEARFALFHAMIGPCLVAEHPLGGADFFMRGAIAERLLYRDFASLGAPPRHGAVPVFPALSRDQLSTMSENSRRLLAMLDIASCVARREPARTYAFFGTGRGNPAERAAMMELAPAISACLFQGQTFDLTLPVFRAFLAEGAYRVAAGQPEVFPANP
jgi:hypothetical protein